MEFRPDTTFIENWSKLKDDEILNSNPKYRKLTKSEYDMLEALGNYFDSYDTIYTKNTKEYKLNDIKQIRNNVFVTTNGYIFISNNTIFLSHIEGPCYIESNVTIQSSTISNTYIGKNTKILNGTHIYGDYTVKDYSGDFGQFAVGSESGGRKVILHINNTFYHICKQAYNLQPHDKNDSTFNTSTSMSPTTTMNIIGENATIHSCPELKNIYIGSYTTISNSTIHHSILLSTHISPIRIQNNVYLINGIIHEGCIIENNCHIKNVIMFEQSSISTHARIHDTVLSADSSIAGGECHRSLIGPFIGFHHHSLLIASLWSFGRGNLGYGAKVGANHTGRVNDQENWPGEGCFFGLGCSIKFPCNLVNSPYSIIAPDTSLSPQCIEFPCSLISSVTIPMLMNAVNNSGNTGGFPIDLSIIKPGWILYGNPYMIERASVKYTTRRKAKYLNTSYPIIRPTFIKKVIEARERLFICIQAYSQFFHIEYDIGFKSDTNNIMDDVVINNNNHHYLSHVISVKYRPPNNTLFHNKDIYFTHKELSGVGRCIVHIKDMIRAWDAYTFTIRRYALHGLVYLLSEICTVEDILTIQHNLNNTMSFNTVNTVFKDNNCINSNTMKDNTFISMMQHYEEDLEYYNINNHITQQHRTKTNYLIHGDSSTKPYTDISPLLLPGTTTPYIHTHQLSILFSEYSTNFTSLHHLFNELEECLVSPLKIPSTSTSDIASVSNSQDPLVKKTLSSLLDTLIQYEQIYTQQIISCRQKDTERGVTIIPDYTDGHTEAQDIMNDKIIANRVSQMNQLVEYIMELKLRFHL